MEGQRRARAALASERNEAAGTLAALRAERASLAAQRCRIETEAAPIRYVAELLGGDTDSERAIRWLIALMVAVLRSPGDRMPRCRHGDKPAPETTLVRSTLDSCPAHAIERHSGSRPIPDRHLLARTSQALTHKYHRAA
jgi:hypothetical protein